MEVNGTDLAMIRGDTETIKVSMIDTDGSPVPLKTGDIIYFTVKVSTLTEAIVLQKIVTYFTDSGEALITILPKNTRNLEPRLYVYDIQLTRADGTVKTIIHPSSFNVKGEVTYD